MEKQIKSIKKEKTMNGQVHFTLRQWWPAKDCTSKSHAGWLLNVNRRVRVCVRVWRAEAASAAAAAAEIEAKAEASGTWKIS